MTGSSAAQVSIFHPPQQKKFLHSNCLNFLFIEISQMRQNYVLAQQQPSNFIFAEQTQQQQPQQQHVHYITVQNDQDTEETEIEPHVSLNETQIAVDALIQSVSGETAKNFQTIFNVLDNLTEIVVRLDAKVDVLLKNTTTSNQPSTATANQQMPTQNISPPPSEELAIKKVTQCTVKEAEELNYALGGDPEYHNKLKDKLMREFGTNISGEKKKNVAHDLADRLLHGLFAKRTNCSTQHLRASSFFLPFHCE